MGKRENKCEHCKWRVLGSYDIKYGGRPIGCSKPEELMELGELCFEERKEETNDKIQGSKILWPGVTRAGRGFDKGF